MTLNTDQIAFWNGPAGDKWASNQVNLDRGLAEAATALMAFAAPRPGEQVLDVGCGAGALSYLMAGKVGASGAVTGVDISAPMLAVARARGNASNVTFVESDAAAHAFTPSYDLIVSRFGVMFFNDPVKAFANIRSALKPGGRLAFVCWRAVAENEWVTLPFAAAKPLLPPQPPADPDAPGPFAFADAARVRAVLENAGWRDVRIQAFDGKMDLGDTPEQAAIQLTRVVGPVSRALRDVDDASRARVHAAVLGALTAFHQASGGLKPGIACWLVGAKA